MASRTFLQRAGRALIGLSLIVLLAGCQTFSFDPDSVQASTPTAHGNALIPFHLMGDDEPDWLIPPDNAAPLVTITRQNKLAEYDFSGLSFLFYFVTLTLVPAYEEHTYIDSYELNWKGMSLVKSDIEYTIDGYFSVYFPTPLFLGSLSSDPEYQKQIAQDYLYDFHKSHLLTAIDQQREEFERIDPQTREELADYLIGPGQSSVYRPSALTRLAQLAPKDEALAYHTEHASIPGYIEVLPESEQAWLIGPEGLKGFELKAKLNQGAGADELLVQVLNAYPEDEYAIPVVVNGQITDIREFPSGYYNGLTDNHREILKAGGLPAGLVDRMTNEAPDPQLLAAARSGKLRDANGNIRIPTEDELLEQLVRHDNQGQYMSPYTSDDVLAEWVNSAINANIGATAGTGVGAVAGAYLGEKALEQIPFVGGFLGGAVGAEIGKSVGRETAISASGGWEAIRAGSDRSFDDIASMARYLKAKYGTTENFADAMNATRQIYPELAEVLAQVR